MVVVELFSYLDHLPAYTLCIDKQKLLNMLVTQTNTEIIIILSKHCS